MANASQANRELGSAGRSAGRLGDAFKKAGKIGALGLAGLGAAAGAFAAVSVRSVARIERIGAQTDAAVKSTGQIANVTRKQIDALAGSLENATATEAESITEGANLLLTFTNIRNETGKGNKVFDQAVVALTDMTRALDNTGGSTIDTRKQATQLGKALNDPIKGVTALAKVGVSFTDQQKKTIKSLVESGDTMKAQKIILRELTKEFGGSGEAFAKTTTGQIELAKHELGTLGETIVAGVLPHLGDLATKGTEGLRWATAFAESDIAPRVGELAAYVKENRTEVIEFAKGLGDRLLPILQDVGDLAVDVGKNFIDMTQPIADNAIPVLDTLIDVTGDVVGFLNDLPGPVKDIGIQAGIAALILPRLTLAISTSASAFSRGAIAAGGYYGALRYGAASSAAATAAAGRLGGAAKNAAGIGGILALTSGLNEVSQEGTTATGVLKGVAGGAGIGAMFGPMGALVGAAAGGGLVALKGALAQTAEEAARTQAQLSKVQGFADATNDAEKLADALRGVVNAYGDTSRAAVEASLHDETTGQLEGDIQRLRDLGVSMDTIVSATLGQSKAQDKVNESLAASLNGLRGQADSAKSELDKYAAYQQKVKADLLKIPEGTMEYDDAASNLDVIEAKLAEYQATYDAAKASVTEATTAQTNFANRIGETGRVLDAHRVQVQTLASDLGITVAAYNKLPNKVRTEFESNGLRQTADGTIRLIKDYKGLQSFRRISTLVTAPGVDLSRRQINKLAGQYKLTPKQVKTLVRLENISPTIRNAKQVDNSLRDIGKKGPDFKGARRSFASFYSDAEGVVSRGGVQITQKLKNGTKGAKPNLSAFQGAITSGMVTGRQNAATGSAGIGSAARTGFSAGFSGADNLWSNAVRTAVAAAIRAGRDEARVNSPSKETAYIGEMMGKGLVVGLDARKKGAKKSGRDLIAATLAGIKDGSDGVSKSLERLTKLIEKRIKLKDPKKEAAREKAVLKSLRDEYAALTKNGKLQDRNANKLAAATERLKQLRNEAKQYANSIRDSAVSYGSVVGLGTLGDSTQITADRIISQLRAREAAVKQYSALIKKLRKQGLNATTIQQLLDSGVEGGLATAQAIAAGGSSAIGQINSLTSSITQSGSALGSAMAKEFKQAGIDAAEGLVKGLKARERDLDKIARRLASVLTAAVKKQLGIKSPSRVFRAIGDDTVRGLGLGLDETYVRRQGAATAGALVSGFARPTLTPTVSMPAASSASRPSAVTLTVNVNAGAGASPVAIGREAVRAIDAYFTAGGKTTVKW